jgi:hypothetical protein
LTLALLDSRSSAVIDVPDFEASEPFASWTHMRPLVDVVPPAATVVLRAPRG